MNHTKATTSGIRMNKSDKVVLDELKAMCPQRGFSDFVRDGLRMYLLIKKSNSALDPLDWVAQTVREEEFT